MGRHLGYVFLVLNAGLLMSCVSLDIQPKTKPAENLYFSQPNPPFVEKETESLDAYFMEPNTGNSISIKSACHDPADPSLESLEKSAFSGMTIIKELSSSRQEFNRREALRSKRLVKIDGIPVIVEMLVLKKNSCNYIITHVGIEKNFPKTSGSFTQFLKDVRTP